LDTEVFKNAKPASVLLGAALVGVAAHAAYAILNVQAAGFDTLFSSWAFYGLSLLVLGAAVARPGLVHAERRAWTAAAVAFAAWFMGSIFYASGGNAEKDLYVFPLADALLLPFGIAATLSVAMLVRSRVATFQPTLLLDGLIISMAAAAVVGALMDTTFLHGIEASTTVISLKVAYPLGSVILLSFSIWVLALSGWRPNRTWIAAVGGFALTGIASTAFLLQTVKGDYTPGTFLDSLWLGGGLMLAYAAWQPHEEPTPVRLEGESRMTATSLGAAVALSVLVLGQFLPVGFAAVALAAVAMVALIARAAVSFKESLQMFADARLEAQTDSLTALGNRRKLMMDLRRELQVASVQSPRVLVLFDLDGFKRYNDTYGHPAGDVLLARLGGNLGRAIKPYGEAYRIGGDEFCVLVMTGASSAKTIIALAASAGLGALAVGLLARRPAAELVRWE